MNAGISARSARLWQRRSGHQRSEHEVVAQAAADQSGQRGLGIVNVGVGQQQIIGRVGPRLGMADALLHRPQLAAPSLGQARRAEHRHPLGARLPRRRRGRRRPRRAVAAVVVNDDDRELAAIVLAQQRTKGGRDHRRFIARGYDGNHRRPGQVVRSRGPPFIVARRRAPEAAARRQQVDPDGAAEHGDEQCRHRR